MLGLAVGSAALVVPLYLSEIAPTEIRGAISSLNQMMIVVGILVAFIVNADRSPRPGSGGSCSALAVVPSLILLVGMFFMPETPRFLVRTGEEDEAREVLDEVTATTRRPSEEIEEIREVERGGGRGLRAARASRGCARR